MSRGGGRDVGEVAGTGTAGDPTTDAATAGSTAVVVAVAAAAGAPADAVSTGAPAAAGGGADARGGAGTAASGGVGGADGRGATGAVEGRCALVAVEGAAPAACAAGGTAEIGRGGSTAATGAVSCEANGTCETVPASSTLAARGARSAAPCGDRNTAADGAAFSGGRGPLLAVLPLREEGDAVDRGAPFDALLFGAFVELRGARDDARGVVSTANIAAMRSACVIPAMSGGTLGADRGDGRFGIELGADEGLGRFGIAPGAVDGVGDDTGEAATVSPPGDTDAPAGDADDFVDAEPAGCAPSLDAACKIVGELALERGVASGARRTT